MVTKFNLGNRIITSIKKKNQPEICIWQEGRNLFHPPLHFEDQLKKCQSVIRLVSRVPENKSEVDVLGVNEIQF